MGRVEIVRYYPTAKRLKRNFEGVFLSLIVVLKLQVWDAMLFLLALVVGCKVLFQPLESLAFHPLALTNAFSSS